MKPVKFTLGFALALLVVGTVLAPPAMAQEAAAAATHQSQSYVQ